MYGVVEKEDDSILRDLRIEESRGGFVLLERTTPLDRDAVSTSSGSHRLMVLDKHGKPSLRKTIVSVRWGKSGFWIVVLFSKSTRRARISTGTNPIRSPDNFENLTVTSSSKDTCLVEIFIKIRSVFTALHKMQTRSSDGNYVRPSVCLSVRLTVRPSVTCVNCDKTVQQSVQIYIPYERSFSLVFRKEE